MGLFGIWGIFVGAFLLLEEKTKQERVGFGVQCFLGVLFIYISFPFSFFFSDWLGMACSLILFFLLFCPREVCSYVGWISDFFFGGLPMKGRKETDGWWMMMTKDQ